MVEHSGLNFAGPCLMVRANLIQAATFRSIALTSYSTNSWFSAETTTFGDRLAAAREAAGLSQSELARKIGVRAKTIAQWELDAMEPRASRLQILAGMLNVSLMWLLNGQGAGLDEPGTESNVAPKIAGVLAEMRQLHGELFGLSTRLGRLEKELRAVSADVSPDLDIDVEPAA
jgi:transcriptional regulator with XRE-family HTH domain